jgi:hypothetical protein
MIPARPFPSTAVPVAAWAETDMTADDITPSIPMKDQLAAEAHV